MKKRILNIICVFIMLLMVSGNIYVPAKAAGQTFLVGYARVDINPYVIDGDITSGIMELPLRGVGDVWNRLSTVGLVDDNGDGKVDEEDGMAVTCIAVSDGDGNTVLLLTIDLIGGGMIDKVRTEICARVDAALTAGEIENVVLTAESIHYAGTHTHEAPDTTVYSASGKTGTNNDGKPLSEINKNLGIWMERTIEDIGDAAILALKDRAPATVTKDALSASKATSDPVKGRTMNSVRHYNNEAGGCVAGDNFNTRGSDPKPVTQVNDNMYLLKFDFPGSDKLPVILANWRGHPSLNCSNDYANSSRNCISSDYPNAFRYTLEYGCTVHKNGSIQSDGIRDYRVAFFNGEGGNVNPRGQAKVDGVYAYKWIDDLAKSQKDSRGNVYGRALAAMAQECLATAENRQTVRNGAVRSVQYVYNSVRKDTGITALAYEAALQYQAEAATKTMSHPWRYTSASGEVFVIGSRFHAPNIISYWETRFQAPKNDLVDMELNAIMIGPDVAMVTVPGEPFDYYYNQDGSNAWKNLIDDTYGTPFVLGYCNGAKGYIPNSRAYDYNLGSTKWQRGSYETSITPYAQGAGERMIELFGMMLEGLASGTGNNREGYCQHCNDMVIWKAYNGATTLYTGHYYLLEDTMAPQIKIAPKSDVCFDLNGRVVKGATRAFYTDANGNSTLNIMDSSPDASGAALGCGGAIGAAAGYGGGGIIIDKGNTLNFYSGNLGVYEKPYFSVHRGGVIRSAGTVNMYGGTILGATVSSFTGDYVSNNTTSTPTTKIAVGATVHNTGTFNMYGGRIEAGKMETITGRATALSTGGYRYSETRTTENAKSYCVYSTGQFRITGKAVVDDLCIDDNKGTVFVVDNRIGPFTGSVQLSFYQNVGGNMKIGTTTDQAALADGTLTVENGLGFVQSGTDLLISMRVYMTDSQGEGHYGSLDSAYAAYLAGNATDGVIRLLTDSSDELAVTKDVCIDLNGCYVTGNITVADGVTLRVKDSQTDDYTIDDEFAYGMMTDVTCQGTGTVTGETGYLKITEKSGSSFHKVELGIDTMSLRPRTVGLYYRSFFKGDEVVAENVRSFGICLSVESAGAAQAMTPGTYTAYTDFAPGEAGNQTASTLVANIMRTGNSNAVNAANAETVIYGCAYLQTDDGFVFGTPVAMSLRQQVEALDGIWRTLSEKQRDAVLSLRFRYSAVMEKWKIPHILS